MESFSFTPASLFRFLTLASSHRLTECEITAILRLVRLDDALVTVKAIERVTDDVVSARMFNRVAR
jgi:hypothetical protein